MEGVASTDKLVWITTAMPSPQNDGPALPYLTSPTPVSFCHSSKEHLLSNLTSRVFVLWVINIICLFPSEKRFAIHSHESEKEGKNPLFSFLQIWTGIVRPEGLSGLLKQITRRGTLSGKKDHWPLSPRGRLYHFLMLNIFKTRICSRRGHLERERSEELFG